MAMVQLTEKDAPGWFDWIANYDKAVSDFLNVWNRLKAQRVWIVANQPSLLATHDAVMQKFRDQVPNIDALGKLRVDVANWLNASGRFVKGAGDALLAIPGAFGTGGQVIANATGLTALMKTVGSWFGLGENDGLGIAPVVWVGITLAGALGTIAIISNVISSGAIYAQSMDAFQAALKAGATPAQAAQSVRDVVNAAGAAKAQGQQEFMGLPLTTIAWATAAIFIVPPVLQYFRERR